MKFKIQWCEREKEKEKEGLGNTLNNVRKISTRRL